MNKTFKQGSLDIEGFAASIFLDSAALHRGYFLGSHAQPVGQQLYRCPTYGRR